jgi:hypothetical protein
MSRGAKGETMLQSSIAWIDFAEEDRRKMMEVVALFKQRDTRDELGLGTIRDAFAELFFPGTSTLQTRARYYLFVPWFYRRYEQLRVPSHKVADRLRGDEVKLIRSLQDAGESDGVIGSVSGASLQRFPASIYWNGLSRWGILRYSGSQGQYHRWLDHFYRRRYHQQVTDDGEPVEGWGGANWDPGLPEAPEGFPERAGFQITPEEAAYLRQRVMLSCHDSLFATLLDRCEPVDDVEFVWLHPQLALFPSIQQEWIAHARNFSESMRGAVLLYNLMLAELSEQGDGIEEYEASLDVWREGLMARSAQFAAWNRREFWTLAMDHGRIPMPTRRFVNDWLGLSLVGGVPEDVASSEAARALVHDREVWLKRGRSRLENRRHLEMWSGAAGTAQLGYRWAIGSRIANDILRGLRMS